MYVCTFVYVPERSTITDNNHALVCEIIGKRRRKKTLFVVAVHVCCVRREYAGSYEIYNILYCTTNRHSKCK